MIRVIRNALFSWIIVTCLIIFESTWIYVRNGLAGFSAFMQEGPYTNVPLTLASVAITWLLAGFLLLLLFKNKITKTTLIGWIGFFVIAISYLNILRERVRYGDIAYYTEAAFSIIKGQSLPDTYLYPPLWATLLSFLTPFGENGILLIAWVANLLSLFLFYFLLRRILEHYQFKPQFAALIATLFILVNMPVLRTLMYVQVNFHVINFIFLGILLYKDRPFLSALAMALAVHLKASPVLLILAFLLEFNWKWLTYFAINILLITAFTVANNGFNPYFDFINNFLSLNVPRSLSLHDNSFDSIIGITLSYVRANPSIVRILVYLAKGTTALIAIILSLKTKTYFPEKENGSRIFNSIIPLFIAMTIFSPLIWEHHGIFITLPFLLLIKKLESPAEWTLFGIAYLFVFLIPTFDYFPWSYERLPGMLILLGLAWVTVKRNDSHYFSTFNNWAESLIVSERQISR